MGENDEETDRSSSKSPLFRYIIYILFVLIVTFFASILLIHVLRVNKKAKVIPPINPRQSSPIFAKKPNPPRQPVEIFILNPIRERSNKIIDAFTKRNITDLSNLIANAKPSELYDYNLKSHLYQKIIWSERIDLFRVLLSSNVIDVNKHSILHFVIQYFHLENYETQEPFLSILLEYHADVNYVNSEGLTPLAVAIKWENIGALGFLLDNGAKLNISLPKFESHLHYAIEGLDAVNNEVVRLLIIRGANVFHYGKDGCTAFHRAIFLKCNSETLSIFTDTIPRGFDETEYKNALLNYPVSKIEVSKPSESTFYGYTPLHLAVQTRAPTTVQFFLKMGCKRDGKDNGGLTARDHAQIMKQPELINLLS